ncbi:GpE family phage tail protein [Pectobacterium polaris]|nr:GpE family phage tail protein [Pectobacterium polaris]
MRWTRRTTWRCRNDFSSYLGWITQPALLWKAQALLARWFRFQPSEIDALELDDFERWLDEASEQIKRENGEED